MLLSNFGSPTVCSAGRVRCVNSALAATVGWYSTTVAARTTRRSPKTSASIPQRTTWIPRVPVTSPFTHLPLHPFRRFGRCLVRARIRSMSDYFLRDAALGVKSCSEYFSPSYDDDVEGACGDVRSRRIPCITRGWLTHNHCSAVPRSASHPGYNAGFLQSQQGCE